MRIAPTPQQWHRLFPYRCPICDRLVMFQISVTAHLAAEHRWWQRVAWWWRRRRDAGDDHHPIL